MIANNLPQILYIVGSLMFVAGSILSMVRP